MKCPECGKENQENNQFCISCGRRFPRCPSCGELLTKRVRFCTKDGTPIPEDVFALIPEEQEAPAVVSTEATAVVTEDPAMTSVCVRCGSPAQEGRKLCDNCRRELMQRKVEREAAARNGGRRFCVRCGKLCETPEQRICDSCRNAETADVPEEWKEQRKPKLWLIILIVVLVLALIGGGIAIAAGDLFDSKPQSSQQEEPEEEEAPEEDETPKETAASETEVLVEDPVVSTEAPTQAPTEAPTEAPTQAPTEAPTEPEPEGDQLAYLVDNCDKVYFTETDLQGMTAEQLRIARNACYAKSGRKFKDAALQEYFEDYDWYNPRYSPDSFDSDLLNQYQEANIIFIKDYEAKKGY